ncbi:5-(carboxyamino)imidazole ribonucleotide mutase [Methanobrevibacter arboriphilus JCM 13429 = DSM 1125]|uniref:N5-carboxyaminoimidazole ribonucleotide mutase n=1 Tax=Methanobrevibacter arboriphilus JCM 13429 = DSM 1125 TaxID=1300164 RepID=A0A1V6N4G1_METAZ|nr:5-(carboxyamino)imidazole ribonucleotide mutase [Methanobrevibacter arboriphilus]OQD59366.1 5-(carboxyamino)imidazole ribonucleotide mutase [Methanobrevibacter arboriphilus JCM 13429 = DSM 1125]
MNPKVMIILGSASDLKIAQKSIDIFETLQIPYSLKVASAHRTHEKVKKLVVEATTNGIEVFMGIAGLAAHLPGSIAAYTHKPVIGVPVDVKLGGLDALFASSQMPFPAPVATVGIDRGDNGAILAGQIIGVNDPEVKKRVSKLRKSYQEKVKIDEEKLISQLDGKLLQKNFLDNYDEISEEKLNKEEPHTDKIFKESESVESEKNTPLVSVVPGSYSDIEEAKNVALTLDRLGISYDISVISPIRYPDKFNKYMENMKDVKLFIAVTGLSAHVTGSIVALSEKPVIGVPRSVEINGLDSLLSMVNMPPGVPVGTVGIENGRNAGVLAGEILGISDKNIEEKLKLMKYKTADI